MNLLVIKCKHRPFPSSSYEQLKNYRSNITQNIVLDNLRTKGIASKKHDTIFSEEINRNHMRFAE